MKKRTHRVLAVLLCGALVFSGVLPVNVYAEEEQVQKDTATVQEEDTGALPEEEDLVTPTAESGVDQEVQQGETEGAQEGTTSAEGFPVSPSSDPDSRTAEPEMSAESAGGSVSTEEPANGMDQIMTSLENEVMPAADTVTLSAPGFMAAKRTVEGAPYSGLANVMWVSLGNGKIAADYKFTVTAPSGSTKDVTLDSALSETKPSLARWVYEPKESGEYKINVYSTEDEVKETSLGSITLRLNKVTFHKGNTGGLSLDGKEGLQGGGDGTFYTFATNYEFVMFLPCPKVETQGENAIFLGWMDTEPDGSKTYTSDDVKNLKLGTADMDLYSVQGTKLDYKYGFYKTRDTSQKIDLPNIDVVGEVEVGSTEKFASVYLHNEGTAPITVPVGSKGDFIIRSEIAAGDSTDGKLNPEKWAEIQFSLKEGVSVGEHSETFSLRLDGSGGIVFYNMKATVTKKTVKIKLLDLKKTYGEMKRTADVSAVDENGNSITLSDYGVVLNCNGFSDTADATAEGYPFTLAAVTNPNYEVTLAEESGKLIVEKAEPKGTVSAEGVKVGSLLSASKLSGTFYHEQHLEWAVTGTLKWDDETKTLNEAGEISCRWMFTPTGEDAKNYTSCTGTTVVVVSEKTATNLFASSPNQYEYGAISRTMTFRSDRPSGKAGPITVEYQRDGTAEWTTEAPVDAGTYNVKAFMPENDEYAEGYLEARLTIKQRQLGVQYSTTGSKMYDGTVDAKQIVKVTVDKSWVYNKDKESVAIADGYTAVFSDANAGNLKNITINNVSLTGERAGNYMVIAGPYTTKADITPKGITAAVNEGKKPSKEYGQELELSADSFVFTGLVEGESADAVFLSEGTAYDAAVNTYDVTVEVQNSNYKLNNPVLTGALEVTKATPELLPGTLNTSSGYEGQTLSTVSVSGTFVNPHRHDMVLEGSFRWSNGEIKLTDGGGKVHKNAEWEFDPTDTRNYNSPETGQTDITLLDKMPIEISVEDQIVTYNGEPQAFDKAHVTITKDAVDPKDPAKGKIDPQNVPLEFAYRSYSELVPAALTVSDSLDTWTEDPPTEAGIYEVKIIAEAGPYSDTRSSNEITATLTIQKAKVNTEGLQKELTVPQGTAAAALGEQLGTVKGVKDEALSGAFSWTESGTIEQDGLTYHWTFSPDGEASKNYEGASGEVTVHLAADNRVLTAEVYNLPDGAEYGDYAVVKFPEEGLKDGEVVTIYSVGGNPVGTATVTANDVSNKWIVIPLDADALGNDAAELTARISSSVMHAGNVIESPAELDVKVEESITVYVDGEKQLLAQLVGCEPELVKKVSFTVNEGENVTVESKEKELSALVKGVGLGHSHVELRVALQHPDQVRHPDGEIIITKTVHVTVVLHPGEVNVETESEKGAPTVTLPAEEQDSLQDKVLTPADKEKVEQGDDILVELVIANADSTVSSEEKEAVKACIDAHCPGYIVGQYLDISLYKTIIGEEREPIFDTNQPITLTITVPAELRAAGRIFQIIRMHNGSAVVLEDRDDDPDTITIQTDQFSTYAIAYRDPVSSLTVSKRVTGSGDKNKAFTFTVTLGEKSVSGRYGDMNFTDGVAKFTLKHGESLTAEGLPTGVTYTVAEAEANKDGYTTTSTGASGSLKEGENVAAFVNHRETAQASSGSSTGNSASPQTGDASTPLLWLLLALLSGVSVCIVFGRRLRRGRAR